MRYKALNLIKLTYDVMVVEKFIYDLTIKRYIIYFFNHFLIIFK